MIKEGPARREANRKRFCDPIGNGAAARSGRIQMRKCMKIKRNQRNHRVRRWKRALSVHTAGISRSWPAKGIEDASRERTLHERGQPRVQLCWPPMASSSIEPGPETFHVSEISQWWLPARAISTLAEFRKRFGVREAHAHALGKSRLWSAECRLLIVVCRDLSSVLWAARA